MLVVFLILHLPSWIYKRKHGQVKLRIPMDEIIQNARVALRTNNNV